MVKITKMEFDFALYRFKVKIEYRSSKLQLILFILFF
jgi:hypothetical protein